MPASLFETILAASILFLAFPSATAVADDGEKYQTVNGWQTVGTMTAQLQESGYDGAVDACSVIATYSDLTGGSVRAADGSAPCSADDAVLVNGPGPTTDLGGQAARLEAC